MEGFQGQGDSTGYQMSNGSSCGDTLSKAFWLVEPLRLPAWVPV